MRLALCALLNRGGDDAFVIFGAKASGKFVQFVGSSHEPLLLDVPIQVLADHEPERLRRLLTEIGSFGQAPADLCQSPEGETVGEHVSFQLALGRDADRAAEISLRIFKDVFLLPDEFALIISES